MTQEIYPNEQELLIYLLSKEIQNAQRECASERNFPSRSADAMDDYIKDTREKTLKLRALRQEVENLFWGEIE